MPGTDEITLIAREYLALGEFKCRWAIQHQLARAIAAGDWNEARKWYRVQSCVRQLGRGSRPAAMLRPMFSGGLPASFAPAHNPPPSAA